MKEGYIKQQDRKKILLLSDDIRFTSGISTMAKEIVIGTAHHFNWVNLGAAINHPEAGQRLDVSADTNKFAGIDDSSVFIYPNNGYGSPEIVRQLIELDIIILPAKTVDIKDISVVVPKSVVVSV